MKSSARSCSRSDVDGDRLPQKPCNLSAAWRVDKPKAEKGEDVQEIESILKEIGAQDEDDGADDKDGEEGEGARDDLIINP